MWKTVTGFLVAVLAVGCAPMVWNKAGASQDDFSRDRYTCLQESQQRVSGAAVNQFGGSSSSTVVTNSGLFGSCMNAHGWYLGPAQSSDHAVQAAAEPTKPHATPLDIEVSQFDIQWQAREGSICFEERYLPLYSKGNCKVRDITAAQIADASKATQVEKALLRQLRVDHDASIQRLISAYRQAGRAKDLAMASTLDAIKGRVDANIDAFVQDSITWGQYNKARLDNAKLSAEDRRRARGL